jgi:hypothetical protein
MFEQPGDNVEKDRSKLVMLMSGVAVAAVIVLIVMVTSFCKGAGRVEMALPGSPEFDSYANNIKIELKDDDKIVGERDLNKVVHYARLVCSVTNAGDKELIGLQLKGVAFGFNNETLREKVVTVIPGSYGDIGPGETVKVEVSMEPIPDPATINNFRVEVAGLKVDSD